MGIYSTLIFTHFSFLRIIPFEEVVDIRSSYSIRVQKLTSDIESSVMRYASTSSPVNQMKKYGLLTPDLSVGAYWLYGIYEYLGTSFLMLLVLNRNIYITLLNMGYIL